MMDADTEPDATRVTTYLDDVARMLAHVDPVERAEVLSGLREHLDEALGPEPTDAQVAAVLAELGDPADVVAEALAGPGGPAVVYASGRPALQRGWVPAVVAILFGLALVIVLLAAGGLAAFSSAEVLVDGEPQGIPREDMAVGIAWGGVIGGMLMALLPWAVGVGLMAGSPLWTGREKLLGAALVPGAALLVGLLVYVSGLLVSMPVLVGGVVLVAAAAIWLLVRLTSAASRRVPH